MAHNMPQVGEFWKSKRWNSHIEILRNSDSYCRVVRYVPDGVPALIWLSAGSIMDRFMLVGTIEDMHAEALEYNALRTAPASDDVLAAEDALRDALKAYGQNDYRILAEVISYQEVMSEHGICSVLGCHVFAPTTPLCLPHLLGGQS